MNLGLNSLLGDRSTLVRSLARSLLAVTLALLSLPVVAPFANASPPSVCLPQPYPVPGLPGPPNWLTSNAWDGMHSNDWLNDPRWTGALGVGYVNGAAPEANFRAVSAGSPPVLYLSWNIRVNPSTTTLWVGFFPETAKGGYAPTGTGYVFQISTNQQTTCTDGIGSCPTDSSTPGNPPYAPPSGPASFIVNGFQETQSQGWAPIAAPWNNSVPQNWRISVLPANPFTWNIEIRIPIDSTGQTGPNLLANNSDTFLFWYDIDQVMPGGVNPSYSWPRPTQYQYNAGGGPPNNQTSIPDPFAANTQWGEIQLQQLNPACPAANVVSLDDISEVGSNTSSPYTPNFTPLNQVINAKGVNYLVARPTNNWNAVIPAGTLNVTFRIADWGSTYDPNAPWTVLPNLQNVPTQQDIGINAPIDIEPTMATTVLDLSNATVGSQSYPAGPACKLRCDLLGGTGSTGGCTCPAAAQAETTDQCILVTLAGNVDFENDSIRRNMEIESASNFERNAQINIQGLPPIGTPTRDVYIFLEKQNMPDFPAIMNGTPKPGPAIAFSANPASIEGRQASVLTWSATGAASCTSPDFKTDNAVSGSARVTPSTTTTYSLTCSNTSASATASATVTVGNVVSGSRPAPNVATAAAAPTTSSPPSVQQTKLLPTYIAHVYHDTGRKTQVKGVNSPILEPQGSFGYFMQHDGLFFGWQTALESVTPGLQITEIAPSFYKLSGVPDGGKVIVKTKISTVDFTTWWIWGILILIVLVVLIILWLIRLLLRSLAHA